MGCACKVNKQISYLQKHYGFGEQKEKKRLFENFSLWRALTVILLLPVMVVAGLLILPFRGKPIKVNKLVKVRG